MDDLRLLPMGIHHRERADPTVVVPQLCQLTTSMLATAASSAVAGCALANQTVPITSRNFYPGEHAGLSSLSWVCARLSPPRLTV